ncbi:MAG: hypothetical protein U1D29_16210 [Burkholderiales bacterium]|nr:hypothetical protein [Burkholderiales bacterium]
MLAKKYILLIVVSILTLRHAHAGGVVAGATEITQIMNNAELVASVQKQIATVRQLADSYVVQYRDLQQQIMAGASIGGVTLGDVMKAKSDIENYQNKLKSFGQDLSGLTNTFDRRLIEAKLLNMSSKDYLLREAKKIKNGNEAAKARVDQERAQIEQINRDVKTIQEYGKNPDHSWCSSIKPIAECSNESTSSANVEIGNAYGPSAGVGPSEQVKRRKSS